MGFSDRAEYRCANASQSVFKPESYHVVHVTSDEYSNPSNGDASLIALFWLLRLLLLEVALALWSAPVGRT